MVQSDAMENMVSRTSTFDLPPKFWFLLLLNCNKVNELYMYTIFVQLRNELKLLNKEYGEYSTVPSIYLVYKDDVTVGFDLGWKSVSS